jgi:hypothetical protein
VSIQTSTSTKNHNPFCDSLPRIFKSLDEGSVKILEKKVSLKKVQSGATEVLYGNINAKRVELESVRDALLNQLSKRVITPKQHEALDAFKTIVSKAEDTMQEQVDLVLKKNTTEITTLLSNRDKETETALRLLKDSIVQAKQKAVADCTRNIDPILIKTTLKSDVANANNTFLKNVNTIEKTMTVTEVAKQKKKLEVTKAILDYKQSVHNATFKLKEALAN